MSFYSLYSQVHDDTYHMQQGLQERVQNCNRIRTGQGSIYLQRVQRQQLEKKLKQAEIWLLQLGKFARLVNYMICQSLVSILEDEITSFVSNILQVRWWVECVEVGRYSRNRLRMQTKMCPPISSNPSFIGPEAETLSFVSTGL